MLQSVGGLMDSQGPTVLARITGLEERQAKFEEEVRDRLSALERDVVDLLTAIGMRAKHIGVPKTQSNSVGNGSLGQYIPTSPPATPYPY